MRRQIVWVLIGAAILAFLAILFGIVGFADYGCDFYPNFYGALVSGSMGGALALIVVLISLELHKGSRIKQLNALRFAFLRQQGENLKEAYIRFVDTLSLGGGSTDNLAGKSWQSQKREFWPDKGTLSQVQSSISALPLPDSISGRAFHEAYMELRSSTQEIMRAISVTAVFEGKEELAGRAIFQADFKVNSLAAKLAPHQLAKDPEALFDPRPYESQIKDAAISIGEVLEDLCDLASVVKVEEVAARSTGAYT